MNEKKLNDYSERLEDIVESIGSTKGKSHLLVAMAISQHMVLVRAICAAHATDRRSSALDLVHKISEVTTRTLVGSMLEISDAMNLSIDDINKDVAALVNAQLIIEPSK